MYSDGTISLIASGNLGQEDVLEVTANFDNVEINEEKLKENYDGVTALILTAENHGETISLESLKSKPNKSTKNKTGNYYYEGHKQIDVITSNEYLLMRATQESKADEVKMLIQKGVSVNCESIQTKETPLIIAATSGFIEIVNILLSHPHLEVNREDCDGNTAFICAILNHHFDCAAAIYKDHATGNCRTEINDKIGRDKYTPLFWTVKEKAIDPINALLALKANVNELCGWNNTTPLLKAAADGSLDIMKILLENRADIKIINNLYENCLMLACERIRLNVVEYLLSPPLVATVDINQKNKLEYSALILAVEAFSPSLKDDQLQDLLSIVDLLCKCEGINMELKTHAGKTAFIMAAEFGGLECLKILVENQADINAISNEKKSALALAAVKGHYDIVDYLLGLPGLKEECVIDSLNNAIQSRQENTGIFHRILSNIMQLDLEVHKMREIIMKALFNSAEKGKLEIFEILLRIKDTISNKHIITGSEFLLEEKDEKEETVLYKAAKHGHLSIVVHIFSKFEISVDFAPRKSLFSRIYDKEKISKIVDVLAKYYVDNEKDFINAYIKRISKNKLHFLKILPRLLVKFKSPTVILNQCFDDLLNELKQITNEKYLIFSLVIVACALKECVRVHSLEASDLHKRLDIVIRMIKKCMDTPSMDIKENVMQVLQDPVYESNVGKEYPEITMARSFEAGPLVYCMRYDLHSVLGIEQISKYIKEVFDTFLSSPAVRPTHTLRDIFQIRSKFVFSRSCPLVMLHLEGLSKLMLFILIFLTLRLYNSNNYDSLSDNTFSNPLENLLLIWIIGNWLHEFGEYFEVYKSLQEYFSIWNVLDNLSNLLLTAWLGSVLSHRPDAALILLSVSAIPASLCLLRYLSAWKSVGVLVLTIVAVLKGIRNFLLVLILILAGFGVALFGLIPDKFTDFGNIISRLFYYGLAGVELSSDYEQTNTVFDVMGKIVLVPFVVLTMIVLTNLVIAKLTATYDNFQKSSLERWSMMKAKQTREFLLIRESNPLNMLPTPLNLITAALLPLHFLCIYLKYYSLVNKNNSNFPTSASVSTVSLSGTMSDFLLRLLYSLPIFGPFHETFLCLNDVYTQTQSLPYLLGYILLSPFIFCCYIIILFVNAFRLTEVIIISDSFSTEICGYGRKVIPPHLVDNLPVNKVELVRHTVVIKCLRYEPIQPIQNPPKISDEQDEEDVLPKDYYLRMALSDSLFPRATYYVKIIYRDQVLETKKVEVKNLNEKTNFYGNKNFYIFNGDEKIVIELWETIDSCYYPDVMIGRRIFPLQKWIANGRFEGKFNLTSSGDVRTIIGNVVLNVRRIHLIVDSTEYEADKASREKIEKQGAAASLFTVKDTARIFNYYKNKPAEDLKLT